MIHVIGDIVSIYAFNFLNGNVFNNSFAILEKMYKAVMSHLVITNKKKWLSGYSAAFRHLIYFDLCHTICV